MYAYIAPDVVPQYRERCKNSQHGCGGNQQSSVSESTFPKRYEPFHDKRKGQADSSKRHIQPMLEDNVGKWDDARGWRKCDEEPENREREYGPRLPPSPRGYDQSGNDQKR